MEHNFLGESWGKLATKEKDGLDFDENKVDKAFEKHIDIYSRMQIIKENIEDSNKFTPKDIDTLNTLYEMVFDNVSNYVSAVHDTELAQTPDNTEDMKKDRNIEKMDRIEALDRTRTRAHNALIESLNFLKRNYEKLGLDISWRDDIGYDRNEIREWAQDVMRYISNKKQGAERS